MLSRDPGPEAAADLAEVQERFRQRQEFFDRYAEDSETEMKSVRIRIDLMLESLAAGRAALIQLHRSGQIEDDVMHELERDLDVEEMAMIFQRGD